MPAEFTKTDVERVAALARLKLGDDERTVFAEQLAAILDYAGQVVALDTSGVPTTAHVLDRESVDRPDALRPSLSPDAVLANAPASAHGLFTVPRVIGG